ncbi:uncharacterized protein [Clytia hemisphaerica]|uniref:RGS domain-containing protein n=2 Tax=Clytia hemisphaerica TaxID=252671 RepID=A0A7M6DPN7_9CNID
MSGRRSFYLDSNSVCSAEEDENEGLTTGEPVSFMCLPCSISASCVSSNNYTTASLTFSKVVLTAEETRVYQIPWEKQQKKIQKNKHRSLCFCWCCVCTCLCKPVNNRLSRRVSMSNHDLKRRTACYKNLVEQQKPSVEQIQKWSVSFEDLLFNELGRKLFYLFLQQEHSEENLQFWSEVNGLKDISDCKEKVSRMRSIYKEFIKPMALKEVNIAGNTRRQIEDLMETKPNEKMFDSAQHQVFLMMHRQSYPRFLQSEMFHSILQTTYAYNPNSPKPPLTISNTTPRSIGENDTTENAIEDQPQSGSTHLRKSSPSSDLTLTNPHPSTTNTKQRPKLDNQSADNRNSRSFVSPNQLSPASLHENPTARAEEDDKGVEDSRNTQLDRHHSMPSSQKGQQQKQKLKFDNKLGPRNSSNT